MIVKILNDIIDRNHLSKGIEIQYVAHKNGTYWADKVYDDCVLVTPLDKDMNKILYSSRYYHSSTFKKWTGRNSFYELVERYNKKNMNKENFIPIRMGFDYCTIR